MHTPISLSPHPTLYQIFARIWLRELSRQAGATITLATVPDAALDRLAEQGFELVYLMGVWTLGAEGRRISRTHPPFREDYQRLLPDWREDDVVGSPFAIARYAVSPALGGDAGLATLRRRLADRGMGLILDFVPNHLARDHHWVTERPEYFIRDRDGAPVRGRDPYFPAWPDTAQLDLRLVGTRRALIDTLHDIAGRCDGVRCDMAMLLLEEVFHRTWGAPDVRHAPDDSGAGPGPAGPVAKGEFWAQAIDAVRARHPGFLFIAEVYWQLEWRLQMLGFDYTYDKSFYDRLCHGSADSVAGHLDAAMGYQRRSVRFVENHDEPRIAAELPPAHARAAILLAATVPGLRFFHHGQREGRRVRTSVHLARGMDEPVDPGMAAFHDTLLATLRHPTLRRGSFARLHPRGQDAGGFIAYRWETPRRDSAPIVVVVNYSAAGGGAGGTDPGAPPARCRVPLDIAGIGGRSVVLADLLSGAEYRRDGDTLLDPTRGLEVALPAYGAHLFELRSSSGADPG